MKITLKSLFPLTLFVLVIFLLIFYFGQNLITPFSWGAGGKILAWVFLTSMILFPFASFFLPQKFKGLTYTLLGFIGLLLLCFFFFDLVSIFLSPTLRFLQLKALLSLGLSLLSSSLGLWWAKRPPKVENITIPLVNLPAALQGFTIVQISDVHIGPTLRKEFLRKVVSTINTLTPHAIVITGDFVDGTVEQLQDEVQPLVDLQSTYGTFYVTGNHEYYWGGPQWKAHLKQLGVKVLSNEHQVIEHQGGRIVMAGINDISASHHPSEAPDIQKALQGAPPDGFRVLLAHQPKICYKAVQFGIDLQLSGHTHAGQAYPWNLLVSLVQPFLKGLHQVSGGGQNESLHKMWLYVNRGTGYWGPPNRLGIPAEITCIKLARNT